MPFSVALETSGASAAGLRCHHPPYSIYNWHTTYPSTRANLSRHPLKQRLRIVQVASVVRPSSIPTLARVRGLVPVLRRSEGWYGGTVCVLVLMRYCRRQNTLTTLQSLHFRGQ
jgi:hypothetical protein